MHRSIRPVLGLLAAVTLVAGLAAPSYADHVVVDDARGDLVKVVEGEVHTTPAPDARWGDLLLTTIRHTRDRIIVDVAFADLRPAGKRLQIWVDMKEPGGRFALLGITAAPGDRAGTTRLMWARGGDIACRVQHAINYDDDDVHASLPTRCLGHPHALRFRVLSEQSRRSRTLAWIDNGLTTRRIWSRVWTAPVAAG